MLCSPMLPLVVNAEERGNTMAQDTHGGRTDSKYRIDTRDQICPLLAGLKRMGCRGLHCQWWIPSEDIDAGECAMVHVALALRLAPDQSALEALKTKQRLADEWHGTLPKRGDTKTLEADMMAGVLKRHRTDRGQPR